VVKYDEIAEHKGTAYARLSSLSIRGKMALRFDRDVATALKLFAAFERESPPSGAGPLDHRVGAWRGLALLLAGEDEHAAQILRTAVTRMTTSDCALELASAAVFLAEVEWRLGEEQAADDAADIALDAARTQGSTFLLLEALRFFPAVASRRIDAEPSGAGDWHEVGRQLRAPDEPDRSVQPTGSALLREFGSVALLVDGKEVPTGIRKSLELLAYLLDHGGRAPRERILADVFGGQGRSAQAYLRQARSQLSRAIAWPSAIVADGEELRVSDEFPVSSESVEVEDQLRSARHLDPRARLRVIVDVLDRAQGDLLKGVRSDWVEQRREHVRVLLTEAAHDAARLTFADEKYAAARDYAERVLRDEPYRETAWQILMQVAAALGDDDGVILAYRECERALAELHAEPSATTRKLLQQLRR